LGKGGGLPQGSWGDRKSRGKTAVGERDGHCGRKRLKDAKGMKRGRGLWEAVSLKRRGLREIL